MLSWYTIRPPRGKHPCPAFANMLLNPSSPLFYFLIFSRLSPSASFMTFTLLTLQLSWAPVFTRSCKNWTVSTSPDYFRQKFLFWFELFCFSLPLSSPRKEIIISVGHSLQHCTHPLCPANWIWYSYLKQPLSLIRESIHKKMSQSYNYMHRRLDHNFSWIRYVCSQPSINKFQRNLETFQPGYYLK